MSKSPQLRDYVLATKYSDGDPGDHYAVGFLRQIDQRYGDIRYIVVDNNETPFRANGFRRCESITDAEGRWLIQHFPDFKPFEHGEDEFGNDVQVGWSVWEWLAHYRASLTHQLSRDL